MKRLFPMVVAVGLILTACSDTPTSLQTDTNAPKVQADVPSVPTVSLLRTAPQAELVVTPNGWYHRSCVSEIPAGAVSDSDGATTLKDGSLLKRSTCLFPGRRNKYGQREIVAPVNDGWMEDAYYVLPGGHNYRDLSANWTVPNNPAGAYSGVNTYFTFPGFQSSEYIIQPVLQYGYNGAFGGSYWTLASWHCDDGEDCTYSTPISASTGDAILGTVNASDCSGGQCSWTVVTRNVSTQTQTSRSWTDTESYPFATGGAVEARGGISSCSQYPSNGVSYTNISLYDDTNSAVTPSWTPSYAWGTTPWCDFSVTHTAATVSLAHPPMYVGIDGPTSISSSGTYQWSADVTGGAGGYTYQWYFRTDHNTGLCTVQTSWESAGTGSTMQHYVMVPGYTPEIRLEVTSSGGQWQFDSQHVALSRYMECPEKALTDVGASAR